MKAIRVLTIGGLIVSLAGCGGTNKEGVFKYDRPQISAVKRLAVLGFVGEIKSGASRISMRQMFQSALADFRRYYIIPDDSVRQTVIDMGVKETPQGYDVSALRRVARELKADAVLYGENFSTYATEKQGKYILGGKDLLPHFHALLMTGEGLIIWKAWAEGVAGKETQLKKKLTLGLAGDEEQQREAVENALQTLADYLVRGELPSAVDTNPHAPAQL
jgi:hypothetical protein